MTQDYVRFSPTPLPKSCAKHEERALRLMYELRALPPPNQKVFVGPPLNWVAVGPAYEWGQA